jgi:hypothetical protein
MRYAVIPPFLALAFFSVEAAAHIRLDVPKGRYNEDPQQSTKQKQGPCGVSNDSRTTNADLITSYKPGEMITVEWTETINHPGHFRIAFLEKGQAFPAATVEPGNVGGAILAEDILDDNSKAGGKFSQMVTLPNVTCDNCTLQLIQVMTDSGDFYFQCADLVLEGDGSGGSGGTGGMGGATLGGTSNAGKGGQAAAGRGGSGGAAGGTAGVGGASGGTPAIGGGSGGAPAMGGSGIVAPTGGNGGGASNTGGTVAAPTGGSKAVGTAGTPPATPTGGAAATPPTGVASGGSDDEGGCAMRTPKKTDTGLGLLMLGTAAAFLRKRRAHESQTARRR